MNGLLDFTVSIWVYFERFNTDIDCIFSVVNDRHGAADDVALCTNYVSVMRNGSMHKRTGYPKVEKWVHMVMVRDATNDNLKVYYDNTLVGDYDGYFDNTKTVVAKEIMVGNDRNCEGGCLSLDR